MTLQPYHLYIADAAHRILDRCAVVIAAVKAGDLIGVEYRAGFQERNSWAISVPVSVIVELFLDRWTNERSHLPLSSR